MMRSIIVFLSQILIIFCCCAQANTNPILQQVLKDVHNEQLLAIHKIDKLDQQVSTYLSTLDITSGAWSEFDYKDHKRINPSWMPVLERMRLMTLAYTHPNSVYFNSEVLYKAINRSLHFFTAQRPLPYCDNWYIQGITRPQSLTKSLINMHFGAKGLEPKVERNLRRAIVVDTARNSPGRNNPNHKYNFGANKAQIAKGWVIIGAVLGDMAMVETGIKEVYAPIHRTTGEGIQHDLSYDMHYGYLYNGAYGIDFMESVLETASLTKHTPYALSGGKLELFRDFVTESIFGLIRGQWIDWNVLGRGISRVDATRKILTSAIDRLIAIDPIGKVRYEEIYSRLSGESLPSYEVVPSHRHYWATDYTVHKRPNYTFSVHAVSNRNFSQEIGNQENLKGYWGAQGTTNLQVRGDEYYNIFPLWNWARLPGVTVPDTVPILKDKAPGAGDRRGTDSFSGGVSDSLYGVTAYKVSNDLQTSYKKSWFMFDKQVVCLGAGISSTSMLPIYTTLNQCLLAHDKQVYVRKRGENEVKQFAGQEYHGDVEGVWHDHVGYYFPKAQSVALTVENRTGDWHAIRSSQQTEKIESNAVFQLSLQHGVNPYNASYAYMLLPGIDKPESFLQFLDNDPITIRFNTDSLQAVYHHLLKIRQMVFYSHAAVYEDEGVRIETTDPVILMLKQLRYDRYELHVSDPTQYRKRVRISIMFKQEGQIRHCEIALNQAPYAGSSQKVMLEF